MIFLVDLLNSKLMTAAWSVAGTCQIIAIYGIALFMILEFGNHLIGFYMGRNQLDLRRPFFLVAMVFLVGAYRPVATIVMELTESISIAVSEAQGGTAKNFYDALSSTNKLKMAEYIVSDDGERFTHRETGKVYTKDQIDKMVEENEFSFKDLFTGAVNLTDLFLGMLADGITSIVRFVLEILVLVMVAILISVGPLAMMFTCAPWFGDGILRKWFTEFLALCCWPITMSVIDLMIDQYSKPSAGAGDVFPISGLAAVYGNWWVSLGINIVFILCYILVPKITSYYIGSGGGSLLSGGIQAGATALAVGAMATGKMPGVGGGGSGGSAGGGSTGGGEGNAGGSGWMQRVGAAASAAVNPLEHARTAATAVRSTGRAVNDIVDGVRSGGSVYKSKDNNIGGFY